MCPLPGEYAAPPFLSREAKDLLRKLLTTEPTRRITPEQASNHAWCLPAAGAVVRPGGEMGGAVAQLAAESRPDSLVLSKMEASYGYDSLSVSKELIEGKHSDASATYYLLRLRDLRANPAQPPSAAAAASGSQSARSSVASRPQSGVGAADVRAPLSARDGNNRPAPVPNAGGKENMAAMAASMRSPAPPPKFVANAPADPKAYTPTKKLTRSPKPLTLLQSNAAANDSRESRRSSPGLFKSNPPHAAGAAHAVVRANRGGDATLAAFRERMRTETMQASANHPANGAMMTGRPSSARGRRAGAAPWAGATAGGVVPAPPTSTAHERRPPSRSVSPRHRETAAAPAMAAPGASSRRGADFRSRKYNTTQAQPAQTRISNLIGAR